MKNPTTREERKIRDADFKRREQPRLLWNSQQQGTYRSGRDPLKGFGPPLTKWERRANRSEEKLAFIDPVKLKVRTEATAALRAAQRTQIQKAQVRTYAHSKACDALVALRRRKQRARSLRGWLPYAKR